MYLASDRVITEHNQAELSKLERGYRTTLEAITLGVVTTCDDATIIYNYRL